MNSVTVDEVAQVLTTQPDVIILDVRTPGEYEKGHIQGSINIELSALKKNVESLIADKSKTVYAYCLSGSRSELAVPLLERIGYENVHNVTSGLLAWRAKKLPLVT